ncbi:MAG: hypothetical protein D6806_07250 [Deltaproteobacteria bacterium]|nr:MAG: hypothetical protein D6806_07250 [Deltaproteobacteria bacterium]
MLLRPGSVEQPAAGRYQLLVGVALSLGLFLTLILFRRFQKGRVVLQRLAAGVLSASFCYGTCVQLGSDLRASLTVRHYSARMGDAARKVIGKKALLLAWEARKDTFTPLKLDHDLWLGGLRWRDKEKGFPFENVEPDREVFVLANGIPGDRLGILLENRRYDVKKVHDLVFLRLLK